MEKFPTFEGVKSYMTTQKETLKDAFKTKQFGWIFIHFLVVLVCIIFYLSLIVTALGITTNATIASIQYLLPTKSGLPYAPKTIHYDVLKENEKGNDGLYHTEFSIQIHSPAGNSSTNVTLFNHLTGEASCVVSYEGRLAELNSGLASTTDVYQALCTTREAVIDTGNLFVLTDEK